MVSTVLLMCFRQYFYWKYIVSVIKSFFKCIVTRLLQHDSRHGSASKTPTHRRLFAVVGHICDFNGENKALRRQLEQGWKQKRDCLINNGVDDAKI